jgi:hypothetical protein
MANIPNVPSENVTQLGDDIKKQFESLGNDLKDQIMKDFNKIAQSDLSNLKSSLSKIILAQDNKMVKQSEQNLQDAILKQFGGNMFGSVNSIAGASDSSGFNSSDFRAAAGQTLLEIGRSIAVAQFRNG